MIEKTDRKERVGNDHGWCCSCNWPRRIYLFAFCFCVAALHLPSSPFLVGWLTGHTGTAWHHIVYLLLLLSGDGLSFELLIEGCGFLFSNRKICAGYGAHPLNKVQWSSTVIFCCFVLADDDQHLYCFCIYNSYFGILISLIITWIRENSSEIYFICYRLYIKYG